MARQNKKLTPRSRAVKASREMLVEGAASMSGSINRGLTKSVANSLISGAVGQDAFDKRKMKKKIEKKLSYQKANIEVGPVMSGPEQMTGLPLNKKSTNKMKKESTFKMKGFSGFKDESPAKKKTVTINEDGGKTVTRTRRDGSVKKVKEFKAGKKKAFKTTRTFSDGSTKTREFKKGVRGATITKRAGKEGKSELRGNYWRHYSPGEITSQTTRKDRRENIKDTVKGAAKIAAGTAGTIMTAGAFPAATAAVGKLGLGLIGGTVAASLGRGVRDTFQNIKGKIKRNRKNPNRKRL